MNEAFPSLLDENGNRKPFKQFLEDVRKIDQTYNEHYLRAEYNFVQASAEMAAKWEQFAQDGGRYYLQYRTVGDSKVRPEHAAMHGITLPMSDPFWEDFYPPNGWGCRCSVSQVRKGKHPATDSAEAIALGEIATGKDTKRIFHFNAGKEQKTFPDYNPYTVRKCRDCDIAKGNTKLAKGDIVENEVCEACRWVRDCELRHNKRKGTKISSVKNDAELSKPYDERFSIVHKGGKGNVYQHHLHCEAGVDNKFVQAVAKAFSEMEGDCWINPVIRYGSPYRQTFYDDLPEKARCNPDLKTRSYGYIDVKSPTEEDTWVRNAIHASLKQYSCVCFTNDRTSISIDRIQHYNHLIWSDKNYHYDYIFWYIDRRLIKYKRP